MDELVAIHCGDRGLRLSVVTRNGEAIIPHPDADVALLAMYLWQRLAAEPLTANPWPMISPDEAVIALRRALGEPLDALQKERADLAYAVARHRDEVTDLRQRISALENPVVVPRLTAPRLTDAR